MVATIGEWSPLRSAVEMQKFLQVPYLCNMMDMVQYLPLDGSLLEAERKNTPSAAGRTKP